MSAPLLGKGSRQKKKRCKSEKVFPCKFACIPRMRGKTVVRCREPLKGQAKTAVEWVKLIETRIAEANKQRSRKGKSSLFVADKKLQAAKASINPSTLSDRQLKQKFLEASKDKTSSIMALALGKELDRRNAQRKPKEPIPPDKQQIYNGLFRQFQRTNSKSEREFIRKDMEELEILYPGIEPQTKTPTQKKAMSKTNSKESEARLAELTQQWDNLLKKQETKTPSRKVWQQSFDEYARANYSTLVNKQINDAIAQREQIIKRRKSMFDEVFKGEVDRVNKNIATLKAIKTYEDAQNAWGKFGEFGLKNEHKKAIQSAIASGEKVPESVLRDYPELKPKKTISTTSTAKATPKQKTLAAIVVGELMNAQGMRPEESAIALIDHLKSKGQTDVAKRVQRVIDRITGDDSDRMVRWVLDNQDLKPMDLVSKLSQIETSLGISKASPSANNRPRPSTKKPSPKREKVDLGGFDFSETKCGCKYQGTVS